METTKALVTGGAGYFGEVLVQQLLKQGHEVRVLDINRCDVLGVENMQGDIRDPAAVEAACRGVQRIFHAVAQVPLAKDRTLFWSVNCDGTRNLLDKAEMCGAAKVVYISSSAVFGVPDRNPVTRETVPKPAEDYGQAKLAGETLCEAAVGRGLDVSIVRPRTILGHGRLGIFEILFDWVATGYPVPVFGGGHNRYQFVHADDLAAASIAAAFRPGSAIYNIGARRFGTMRELLTALIRHAGSRSRIKSVPIGPAAAAMTVASRLGLSPLGPYHSLMYGRELYFDLSDAERELGFSPTYSSEEAICESFDWFMANRHNLDRSAASAHKSRVRRGALAVAPFLLSAMPS
jgi:nucleoside-diphosphate-sugar epimerase